MALTLEAEGKSLYASMAAKALGRAGWETKNYSYESAEGNRACLIHASNRSEQIVCSAPTLSQAMAAVFMESRKTAFGRKN